MDFKEKFMNDPERKKLLQQIVDAHDNAVISHRLDENEEIIVVYDKYSAINISKLTRQLRLYEQIKYPELFIKHWNCRSSVMEKPNLLNKDFDIETLEKELQKALEKEDFETCEILKNEIKKLKNNGEN